MKTSRIALAVALALAGACQAQTMYRCGNTFSQQPCGSDQKVLPAPGVEQPKVLERLAAQRADEAARNAPPPPADVVERAKKLCAAELKNHVTFKDPDSVKVSTVSRNAMFGLPPHSYTVHANAKNSYGGYVGEKMYPCLMDDSETRVIGFLKPIGDRYN